MSGAVIATDDRAIVLDLSEGATLCGEPIEGQGVDELSALIDRAMAAAGTRFAYGRWAEPRGLYTSELFAAPAGAARRTVHMGIDVFCAPGTPVCTPLDGVVEFVADNDRDLDYGPVVIVRHDGPFHTLYGHLAPETLTHIAPGRHVARGECIGWVGAPPGNGNWPPHLHLQRINDLLGLGTDFPGVAAKSEQDYWLDLSPSPAAWFPDLDPQQLEYC